MAFLISPPGPLLLATVAVEIGLYNCGHSTEYIRGVEQTVNNLEESVPSPANEGYPPRS